MSGKQLLLQKEKFLTRNLDSRPGIAAGLSFLICKIVMMRLGKEWECQSIRVPLGLWFQALRGSRYKDLFKVPQLGSCWVRT